MRSTAKVRQRHARTFSKDTIDQQQFKTTPVLFHHNHLQIPQKHNKASSMGSSFRNRFSIAQKPELIKQEDDHEQSSPLVPKKQFANEYRSNLLRTIYKETQLGIKTKKKRKEHRQAYNVEYLYDPNSIKTRKVSKQSDRFKNTTQSPFMKATSIRKGQRKSELSIRQLPLITQTNKIKDMSELLKKMPSSEHRKAKTITRNEPHNKGSSPLLPKYTIDPWQTFHDQFIE